MKCPKCGFNSFEYYDDCKKCSSDLTGYKQTYSITSMVLPQEAKEKLAAEFLSTESAPEQNTAATEIHEDIFSFDLPDDSPSAAVQNKDPFDFINPSSDVNQADASNSEADAFANLLESTSQSDESPFAAPQTPAPSAAAPSAVSTSGAGEFDLESFSWDDATSDSAAGGGAEGTDDFDSLFGETKENTKK